MEEDVSPYFQCARGRNPLKRSASDNPSFMSDFYPVKKLQKLTPDLRALKKGSFLIKRNPLTEITEVPVCRAVRTPEINKLSDQLLNKAFFPQGKTRRTLFKSNSNLTEVVRDETEERQVDLRIPTCVSPNGSVKSRLKLRTINELPEKFRHVFNFRYFNVLQSEVFDDVLFSDRSLVVSAPTGSGKTVVFELAIIHQLHSKSKIQAIYIAPTKALVSEKYQDWKRMFKDFNIIILELTGDSEDDCKKLINYDLILTTPEKWEVLSRRKPDMSIKLGKLYMNSSFTVMIDEVHLLGDMDRGHVLEAVISRIKMNKAQLRFIAVSATIPNASDVSIWLNNAKLFVFGEDKRPVPLTKIVIGYPKDDVNDFTFEMKLSYKLINLINLYSESKPTLIFTNSRRSAQLTALIISKDFHINTESQLKIGSVASKILDSKLQQCLKSGVGFHHAGLEQHDRRLIEEIFSQGKLPILVATSTLSQGVNLPAHLVIVKGTVCHSTEGTFKEYHHFQILQMIGRAGRPQYDRSATAIIMTTSNHKTKYENIIENLQNIESSMHLKIPEHLNTEIVLRSITKIEDILNWTKTTFLYVRLAKNPQYYGISEGQSETCLRQEIWKLVMKSLYCIRDYGLIQVHQDNKLFPTEIGRVVSHFFISFNTIKLFAELTGEEDLRSLINIISLSDEFKDVILRRSEKELLNKLNKSKNSETIRFPFQTKVHSTSMKINTLIQASFGCLVIQDSNLSREARRIMTLGQRISKCLLQMLWNTSGVNIILLVNAITLSQCFQSGLWENSCYVTKQFDHIGLTYSTLLAEAGFTTFDKILKSNARNIELVVNRSAPFGNNLLTLIRKIPQYVIMVNNLKGWKVEVNLKGNETVAIDLKFFLIISNDKLQEIAKLKLDHSNLPFRYELSDTQLRTSKALKVFLLSESFCGVDVQEEFILPDTDFQSPLNNNALHEEVTSCFHVQEPNINEKFGEKVCYRDIPNVAMNENRYPPSEMANFDIGVDWEDQDIQMDISDLESNKNFIGAKRYDNYQSLTKSKPRHAEFCVEMQESLNDSRIDDSFVFEKKEIYDQTMNDKDIMSTTTSEKSFDADNDDTILLSESKCSMEIDDSNERSRNETMQNSPKRFYSNLFINSPYRIRTNINNHLYATKDVVDPICNNEKQYLSIFNK